MKHTGLLSLILVLAACVWPSQSRQPELWKLPDGYEGWVYSTWDTARCPSLPLKDGYIVVEVPADGVACTSTKFQEGVASDRFVYVSADGAQTEIPRTRAHKRIMGSGSHDVYVFIGSDEDFARVTPMPPR